MTPDNHGNLYIADYANYRIRKVDASGMITTIAGTGTLGYSGDGGPATAAQLNCPACIAIDAHGNLYIADMMNYCIRKINTSGIISTVAGTGVLGTAGDGGPATAAQLGFVYNVIVDGSGNLYIPDEPFNRIRKVNTAGIITTIAGCMTAGYDGDGGPATDAKLNEPWSVALDGSGNLFIADLYNQVIRKVTPAGIISTFAGTGIHGYSGDGGPATAAKIAEPTCITVDHANNLFICDYDNHRVRKVTPAGIISTYAGNGTPGFAGDGSSATAAELNFPSGISFDATGNLYISDLINQRIRKVGPSTTSVASSGSVSENINVYPNPSTGKFTLEIPGGNILAKITLTDYSGRIVDTRTTSDKKISFDITNFPASTYLLQVTTPNKKYDWKVIKN